MSVWRIVISVCMVGVSIVPVDTSVSVLSAINLRHLTTLSASVSCTSIQIVTGIEVTIGNFFPEVGQILGEHCKVPQKVLGAEPQR